MLLRRFYYIVKAINDILMIFSEKISSSKERPKDKSNEVYRKELLGAMRYITEEVNETCGTTLLSEDATVSMKQFGYSKEEVEADKKKMKDKQDTWIRRDNGLNPDVEVSKELRDTWLQDQEKKNKTRKSDLAEMVATVLFHKVLGEEYVIARASKYDDYFGFDNIIVHKATGTVVCTFDDIHDRKEGNTIEEKRREVIRSAQKGGATIKYGFTFKNNLLVKEQIDHVPKLYMAFDMTELNEALESVNVSDMKSISAGEYKAYNRMIENFESQIEMLKSNSTHPTLREHIEKFERLLPELKR